eukprot:1481750-Rhodomonas_salina.1
MQCDASVRSRCKYSRDPRSSRATHKAATSILTSHQSPSPRYPQRPSHLPRAIEAPQHWHKHAGQVLKEGYLVRLMQASRTENTLLIHMIVAEVPCSSNVSR